MLALSIGECQRPTSIGRDAVMLHGFVYPLAMDDRERIDRDEWDGERVRALRDWLDTSQSGLADQLGTRQQTVSEWETGSSRPRRMSRRLLHLVAEESGFYTVERPESNEAGSREAAEPGAASEAATPGAPETTGD